MPKQLPSQHLQLSELNLGNPIVSPIAAGKVHMLRSHKEIYPKLPTIEQYRKDRDAFSFAIGWRRYLSSAAQEGGNPDAHKHAAPDGCLVLQVLVRGGEEGSRDAGDCL